MAEDPLKPNVSLLSKLGSIAVHLDEALSSDGHVFDKISLEVLQSDPEVKVWLAQMDKVGLVPKKRKS